MTKIKEIFILLLYMIAILLFPWLSFLLVRLIATFFRIDPAGILGVFMSAVPNIFMFIIAFSFLKLDDWNFKSIGISINKILPGLIFAILSLTGLYLITPFVISIFFEPNTIYVSLPQFNILYFSNLIRAWVIVGVCEEISSRGFLLNKFYSVFPDFKKSKKITKNEVDANHLNNYSNEGDNKTNKLNINEIIRIVVSILFTSLFFTLIGYIRYKTAGSINVSTNTILTIFLFGVFLSYLYLRTNNLFVAVFMQAALDFPPFGLTVGREGLVLKSFGFIFTCIVFVLFIILLTETYKYWGNKLEFEKVRKEETDSGIEEQQTEETITN